MVRPSTRFHDFSPCLAGRSVADNPNPCSDCLANHFLHDPTRFYGDLVSLTCPPFLGGESTRFTFGKEARAWCRRGPGLILRMASVVGRETWDVSNVE